MNDTNIVAERDQAKYSKYAWAFHNLIAHPLMEILNWVGLSSLGDRIHSATIPRPITKTK
jgi:hypothetical protein